MERWILSVLFLLLADGVAAQWQYRRPVTIGSTGTARTNFQVPVRLTTGTFDYSRAQSDGRDIRFSTDINGASFDGPHWIESYNTAGISTIWIKVPSIPASGGVTLYMHYGNASATDASDGNAVFDFFDDFSGSSLDATKWTVEANQGAITVTGGLLQMIRSPGGNTIRIVTTASFTAPLRVGYRMLLSPSSYYFSSLFVGASDGTRASIGHAIFTNFESALFTGASNAPPRTGAHPSSEGDGITTPPNDAFFTETFTIPGASGFLQRELNGTAPETSTRYQGGVAGPLGFLGRSPGAGFGLSAETHIDYLYTRQYAATEPSVTLGAEDGPLPVELISFRAVFWETKLTLTWQTASETNNAGFELQEQRPSYGSDWQPVGFVAGYGTTTESQDYAYALSRPLPGTHVYRLKQIDFDGATAYSPELRVEVPIESAYHLSTPAPNPARSTTRLTLTVAQSQAITVALYDMLGRQQAVLFEGVLGTGETHTLQLDVAGWPGGSYLIHAAGETFTAHRRVVVAR